MSDVKSFSGDDFQAKAAMNPDVTEASDEGDDDQLKPSEQTDYRSVDNGLTSIGSTTQNADTAVLGLTDTPGVRTGSDVDAPGTKSVGRTIHGPDAEDIAHQTSDAIAGDNVDDKLGEDFINDPDNR